MLTTDIILAKRDGNALNAAQIQAFVQGVTHNTVSDAQIASFCMACLLRGLSPLETALLTQEMAQSGTTLKWNLDRPVIDKHSTGGVGDKVSLMLAPMAASCGLAVPMIAGRGLGHTGGTIDKLESLQGFKTNLPIAAFQKIVREVGCAIIGQTSEFAPADKRIYAVRDVTGTVESIPLITASILSKKLAAGLQGLVLDVKFGNGAFMATREKAEELAQSLARVAVEAGLNAQPVLTDMNAVLGHAAGNSVEVNEAIEYLNGTRRDARLHEVTLSLVAKMLLLGKIVSSFDEGKQRAQASLDSGRAMEVFQQMVAAQGGTLQVSQAPVTIDILADRSGVLKAMDTKGIGNLLIEMGAGRRRAEDRIDLRLGFSDIAPLGTTCEAGKTLIARAHLADKAAAAFIQKSFCELLVIAP